MSESSTLPPGERLSLALKSPQPYKLFRSLPSEDLFLMILDGDSESAQLAIKYATEEQHRDILDFYAWNKDEIRPKYVMEWLTRILQCDDKKLVKVTQKLDPELLTYTFKSYVHVFTRESPDEQIPDVEGACSEAKTLDNIFYYYHLKKSFIKSVDSILSLLFSFNQKAYQNLMHGCEHLLSMELMENAYRWRTSRMEERGFLNYIDSKTIFEELGAEEIRKLKTHVGKEAKCLTASEDEKEITHSYFCEVPEKSFFNSALKIVGEDESVYGIHREMVLTMNKLISASVPAMTDIREIKKCVRRGADMLSLALDYLAEGVAEKAADFLSEISLETLFRVGNSLAQTQARRLKRFFRESHLLNKETLFLLGSPQKELLEGMMKSPPVFYEVDVGEYVGFTKREQLALLGDSMDSAECLDRLFFDHFKLQLEGIEEFSKVNLYQDQLTLSALFVSGLCHIVLNRHFECQPVPESGLEKIRERAFHNQNGVLVLKKEFEMEFNKWFDELTLDVDEKNRKRTKNILESWLREFVDEFAAIHPFCEIDPRHIKTALIKAEQ